ncbi:MAG: plastocyanin/azurin family copper-binding protein [Actinomycetota bacterium]
MAPQASSIPAGVDRAATRGNAQTKASTLLIGVGVLMVCLAIPATLVGAQAPATPADPSAGQPVVPEQPPEPPAPEPQPPPPSTDPPEPSPAPPPASEPPDDATPPPPAPVADPSTEVRAAARSVSVSILDGSSQSAYVFSPSSVTVSTGDTVNWTNNGAEPHDVTGSGLASGLLQSGQGYSHTFTSAGDFSYICSIHPFMQGSVSVLAASGGGGSDSGSTQDPSASTAPGSESAAVTSAGAAGSASQLPSSGMPVLPLLAAGMGLVLAGALLRRRARVS